MYTVALRSSSLQFTGLALSHDGKTIALASQQLYQKQTLPRRQNIELRDSATGAFGSDVLVSAQVRPVRQLAFRPDDMALVTAGETESTQVRPKEIDELEIATGLRTRFVDRDRTWSVFALRHSSQSVLIPFFGDVEAGRLGVELVPFDKLPWKADAELANNRVELKKQRGKAPPFGPDDKEFKNGLGMKFVALPLGEHETGLPGAAGADGQTLPRFFVRIARPLMIAATPVTVGQFRAFTREAAYKTEAERNKSSETWKKPGFAQTDEHPVVYVTWNDAVAFCEWLTKKEDHRYRLPTEGELDYAIRAKTLTEFFFGHDGDLKEFAWARENSELRTHPVGKKKPNPWGLYDVLGNVDQLCSDGFMEERGWVATRGGGGFAATPQTCTATYRNSAATNRPLPTIGF
jgi:formylglycine-generating enzyme required for sulfatase activity